jgi:uncharacterized protein YjbI with pentapeptide repeats
MNLNLKNVLTTTDYVSAAAVGRSLDEISALVTNKPIYVDARQPNFELLNLRSRDFHQEELPAPYSKLTSLQAKKEFEDFWKLVQSIKAEPDAHKFYTIKRLITAKPLELNSFFKEISESEDDFNLSTFLLSHGITLNNALLDDAKLNNAKLNNAKLNGAELNHAYLNDAKLNDAELNDAKLNGAELNDAYLNGAKLNRAKLNGAELNGAELNGAELNGAYLNRAELISAKLNGAELNGAELNGAYLNDAYLNGAELNDAELNDAKLNGAKFDDKTVFNNYTKLQNIDVAQGIYINRILEKDQNKIKAFFMKRGASDTNISFAKEVVT